MVIDHLPEIKLIRTDTTLDLSQKAEKVCSGRGLRFCGTARPVERALCVCVCVRGRDATRRDGKHSKIPKDLSAFLYCFSLDPCGLQTLVIRMEGPVHGNL